MTTTSDRFDVLCDVIEDWLETHKALTRAGIKYEGVERRKLRGTSTCMTPGSTAMSGTARRCASGSPTCEIPRGRRTRLIPARARAGV